MKPGERADHPIELLSASVDRELQPAEAAALEAHLEGCAECRGLLVDFRRLDEAIASEPAPAVPAGIEKRILASLSSRPAPAAPRRIFRQAMPLAAAASLVAAILLWYGRPDRLPPLSPGLPAPSPADSQGNSTPPRASTESRQDAAKRPAAESPTAGKADTPAAGAAISAPAAPAPLARAAAPAPTEAAAGSWKVEEKPGAKDAAQMESLRKVESKQAEKKELSLQDAARQRANVAAAAAAASAPAAPGIAGRDAAPEAVTMAKVEWPRPVGVFAAPYVVTLEGDRRMLVNRGAYACTVPIEDGDGKLLAAAMNEALDRTQAAPRSAAQEASGPRIVTATPQTRDSILRLVRERYRPVLETRCGPLPE